MIRQPFLWFTASALSLALFAALTLGIAATRAANEIGAAPTPRPDDKMDLLFAPAPLTYTENLERLESYLEDNCSPPPNARSCDWGVYHEYSGITHGAMVTGSTTSETQNLMLVFEALYSHVAGDDTALRGILAYLRDHMMPHDGQNDPPHNYCGPPPPYFPCLVHWLIEVDGGTRMGDTGTIVGPNTPYLPYEYHPGEGPIDPDPDRESYISPDDWRYASAPDADQWLVDGLLLAYAFSARTEYHDLAQCIINSLHVGLTTPTDFRYGVVDDFEGGAFSDWWQYFGGGASLITSTMAPGAAGTQHTMSFTYTVPWTGFAGVGKSIAQDWRGYEGVRFWYHGQGAGNSMRVVLTDPAPDAAVEAFGREYFEHIFVDTLSGWRPVQIPFSAFNERADWPPDNATTGNGVLDTDRIQTFALEPLPATFGDDFEDDDPLPWWSYAIEGASLVSGTVSPGAGGSGHALQATYNIAAGYAGLGASPNANWSSHIALAFALRGTDSGNLIGVELAERGNERWEHVLRDDFTGWRTFTIPLTMTQAGFTRRYWQPSGAIQNDVLDLDAIRDIIFTPQPGWFQDDFEDGDAGNWWNYGDPGSTVSRQIITPGANATARALRIVYQVALDGWAGAGKTVERDWRGFDGLRLWLRGSGKVRLVVKDADDEAYAVTIDPLPAAWRSYQLRWQDFVRQPYPPTGNHVLDLNYVRAFIVEAAQPGQTTVFVDELSITGGNLGQGSFALDNVRPQGGQVRSGSGTGWVDEIKLMGDPGLPIYPNVMKFSLQWDQNGKIPWEGPLYTGYQDPTAFCLVGDQGVAGDVVSFLRAAQLAYDEQIAATANLGPFMPIFVQDPQYAADGRPGWTWDGRRADANTQWAQFQYRVFAHLALYYYLSGDADARAVLDDFHGWLTDRWVIQGSRVISLPITMIAGTEEVELGFRSGDFGLAAQGLMLLAARTRQARYRADAEALLNELTLQQDAMGAFQTDRYRFGYEQAEAGIALALHELLFGRDRPNPLLTWLMRDGCSQLQIRRLYLPSLLN